MHRKKGISKVCRAGIAFDDSDDDKPHINAPPARSAMQVQQQQHTPVEDEDPSVSLYDEVYDEIQTQRQTQIMRRQSEKNSESRVPKYMAGLLSAAADRKRQNDIVYNKLVIKDRSKTDHLFQDKEQFMTEAYKQNLIEDQKYEEEQRRKALAEEDVTKKNDMTGFFAAMLNTRAAHRTQHETGLKPEPVVTEESREKETKRFEESLISKTDIAKNKSSSKKRSRSPFSGAKETAFPSKKPATVPKSKYDEESKLSAKERYLLRKAQKSAAADNQ